MRKHTVDWKRAGVTALILGGIQSLLLWHNREWNLAEAACLWIGLPYGMREWEQRDLILFFLGLLAVFGSTARKLGRQLEGYRYFVLLRYHDKSRYGKHFCRMILQSTLSACGMLYCAGAAATAIAVFRGIPVRIPVGQLLVSVCLFTCWQVMLQLAGGAVSFWLKNDTIGFLVQMGIVLLSLPDLGGIYLPGSFGMYVRSDFYYKEGYSLWIAVPIEMILAGIAGAAICGGRYGKDS